MDKEYPIPASTARDLRFQRNAGGEVHGEVGDGSGLQIFIDLTTSYNLNLTS